MIKPTPVFLWFLHFHYNPSFITTCRINTFSSFSSIWFQVKFFKVYWYVKYYILTFKKKNNKDKAVAVIVNMSAKLELPNCDCGSSNQEHSKDHTLEQQVSTCDLCAASFLDIQTFKCHVNLHTNDTCSVKTRTVWPSVT